MVGGFQGGHGKANVLLGPVRVLCRNTPQGDGEHRYQVVLLRMNHNLYFLRADSALSNWHEVPFGSDCPYFLSR